MNTGRPRLTHPMGVARSGEAVPRVTHEGLVGLLVLVPLLAACKRPGHAPEVSVVATTSIVGDVVRKIGGDEVALSVLLPLGVDPHSFEPTPREVVLLSRARLVFTNGRGLEAFLDPLLGTTVAHERIVDLSAPLEHLHGDVHDHEARGRDEDHHTHGTDVHDHSHTGLDPHVWFVPEYVAAWAREAALALSRIDSRNSKLYAQRAESFAEELDSLDAWIRSRVETIPEERRVLVTDHAVLGLFAGTYGFREIGTVVPGFTTLAEPSARDVAALLERIRLLEAPAVFVGASDNPQLANRIAEDGGIQVIRLYTGSLSSPEGPAADYMAFMRHNVEAITTALRGDG